MVGKIKYTKMGEGSFPPTRQHPDDAGFDLSVSRYVQVFPHQSAQLSTGVAIAIPKGYFGLILPRSSTLWNTGLHISPGIIDSGYRGEVMVLAMNTTDRAESVMVGERVAQLLILPVQDWVFTEVPELPDGYRGKEGFGSTGI